jgi:3-methyladenine DNA glycosylase AlkC
MEMAVMERIEQLNQGLVATTNLSECLKVDQDRLFRVVIGPVCGESTMSTMLQSVTDSHPSGILPRMRITGAMLAQRADLYPRMSTHVSDTVRGWACFMLPHLFSGQPLPDLLSVIQPHADDPHFGVREWAWMAVRETLEQNLPLSISLLTPWTADPRANVRRFAVECLRPRGVWCRHISSLKAQPERALPLLEPLKNEPEQYVQDSVANWLNDASKTQPQWVSDLCQRWLTESAAL